MITDTHLLVSDVPLSHSFGLRPISSPDHAPLQRSPTLSVWSPARERVDRGWGRDVGGRSGA